MKETKNPLDKASNYLFESELILFMNGFRKVEFENLSAKKADFKFELVWFRKFQMKFCEYNVFSHFITLRIISNFVPNIIVGVVKNSGPKIAIGFLQST